MALIYLFLAVLLVLLNGFFVLAEFAAVKMRPSRVRELLNDGVRGAVAAKHVQDHLDEYLSVCQVGITFTSIGLGFVGEPAVVRLIEPLLIWSGWFARENATTVLSAHAVAFAISYAIVSYAHILIGELVPKSMAIRRTDRVSLWTAPLLRIFLTMFALPLWVLNGSANYLLNLMGLGKSKGHETHSEDELRILLNQSQSSGLMSFRRLLFLENVFDLGELMVRDAMRPRSQVRCMSTAETIEQNLQIARRYRFSRYPLIDGDEMPSGFVHLKDLLLAGGSSSNLKTLLRPVIVTEETSGLESVLGQGISRNPATAPRVAAGRAYGGDRSQWRRATGPGGIRIRQQPGRAFLVREPGKRPVRRTCPAHGRGIDSIPRSRLGRRWPTGPHGTARPRA